MAGNAALKSKVAMGKAQQSHIGGRNQATMSIASRGGFKANLGGVSPNKGAAGGQSSQKHKTKKAQ